MVKMTTTKTLTVDQVLALRTHVADLHKIVDRSFEVIHESNALIPAFSEAVALAVHANGMGEEKVVAFGTYVAHLDEVEHLLCRARSILHECEEAFS